MTRADPFLFLASTFQGNSLDRETLIPLIGAIEDWDELLRKAIFHRVLLRLYAFLKRYKAPTFLPPEIWKKIESAFLWAQARALALEGELETLLPRFNEARIEVLLLKGAALLQTVYREKPVRFLADLDLLIQREDLTRTKTLLHQLGYEKRAIFPSRWHERELSAGERRAHFEFSKNGLALDLHVETFEAWVPFPLESTRLWEGARPISVNGAQAYLPPPHSLFLHLLFHLAHHARSGGNIFGWYLDLDECLRYFGEAIEGAFCETLLRRSPPAEKALEILAFLDSHLSSPLPPRLKALLQEKKTNPPSLEKVLALPQKPGFSALNFSDSSERFLFYWRRMQGGREKFWLLWRWIFPERRYLQAKYPCQNSLETTRAYLKHFWTMGGKGIKLVAGLIRRSTGNVKKTIFYS